jgi:hypothetical protein
MMMMTVLTVSKSHFSLQAGWRSNKSQRVNSRTGECVLTVVHVTSSYMRYTHYTKDIKGLF